MKKCIFIGLLVLLLNPSSVLAQEGSVVYIRLNGNPGPGARVLNAIGTTTIENMPGVKNLRSLQNPSNSARAIQKSNRLQGIYRMEVEDSAYKGLVKELSRYGNVLEVVKEPKARLLLTPNDSLRSNQDYLALIQAYEAWDVTTGSNEIIVGISDNGVDYDHEDLMQNRYYNEQDPINGIDDDGNGYIDDYFGYDLADGDNDPYPEGLDLHGSAVTGIVAAATNNSTGISGIGFEGRYYPIKVFQSANGISQGTYESIIYAAELGLDVINLSWGSVSEHSQILQDIIDYAVMDHDMVVIAAAGNTDEELNFYPASYDNVLSVGATNINDEKWSFGTYSYNIDVTAPGASVYTTGKDDSYGFESGSSFSAPQVSGVAALVRSTFPELNAVQVMERIRMTSDDIYSVGDNSNYTGQMGKGRLNAYRAVSEENVASLRYYEYTYSGPFGEDVYYGDTVVLELSFINWLRPLVGAEVTISSLSPHVDILNERIIIGTAFEADTLSGYEIVMVLSDETPSSERLIFRMDYHDTEGYEDFQYLEFHTAPNYLTLDNSSVSYSLASDGSSTRDFNSDATIEEITFSGNKVASYSGLIIGTHEDSISDNIIRDYPNGFYSDDFQESTALKRRIREDVPFYARNVFSDSLADIVQGLSIEQEVMAWGHPDSSGFVIMEYFVTNLQDRNREDLSVGYYVDFDLGDSVQNFVRWSDSTGLGYSYEIGSSNYAGMAVLSDQQVLFHAIDLFDAAGAPVDYNSYFEEVDKYTMLSSEKLTAGGGSGNNVAQVLSVQIPDLPALTSEKVAFALVMGSDSLSLQQNLAKAVDKYDSFLSRPDINRVEKSCAEVPVVINSVNELFIYSDPEGEMLEESGTNITLSGMTKDSLLYYREDFGGYLSDLYALQVQISQPEATFRADPDTLFLGDDPANRVQFVDTGLGPVQWSWDFDNGSFSTLQNPRTVYNEEGVYTVTMDVVSDQGCSNIVSKDYHVLTRGTAPVIEDHEICPGNTATISSTSSTSLRFYHNDHDAVPFFEGTEWTTDPLFERVTYYVSSAAESVESVRVPVDVVVDSVQASFVYHIDTLDLSSSQLLTFRDLSENAESLEWRINEQSQGNETLWNFDYAGLQSLNVRLLAESADGCLDSITQVINLSTSPNAGINEQSVCEWGHVALAPVNGEVFVFYNDASQSNILAKGSTAQLGPIVSDTSFYVTNITNYLESDPVEARVRAIDHNPVIMASPDSLELDRSRVVSFSTSSEDLIGYQWYLEGLLVETVSDPVLIFDSLGTYDVRLISEHQSGCLDTASMNYLVYELLNIPRHQNLIRVYPNPAEKVLSIESTTGPIEDLKLYSVTGKAFPIVPTNQSIYRRLNIENLTSGMYILRGVVDGQHFQIKFVKE